MRKMHTEKTDSFKTYDMEQKEYLVHEFTHYNDIQLPEQPLKKVIVAHSYKTDTGEHVQKKSNNNFLILTNYGVKNIEVQKTEIKR